jgi:hypothetical protein
MKQRFEGLYRGDFLAFYSVRRKRAVSLEAKEKGEVGKCVLLEDNLSL